LGLFSPPFTFKLYNSLQGSSIVVGLAIARTTPALLGLFSLITLLAHQLAKSELLPVCQAAWYVKPRPTFSDAFASVQYQLWHQRDFHMSPSSTDVVKIPRSLLTRFIDMLCYAA
jgi:hypothetical protein